MNRVVRHAGTMLGSCECEHVPHDERLKLHVQSREGTTRPDWMSLLAVNFLVEVGLRTEIGRPNTQQRPQRFICATCRAGRSNSQFSRLRNVGERAGSPTAPTSSALTIPLTEWMASATLKAHAPFAFLLSLQHLMHGKWGLRAASIACPSAISLQSLCKKVVVIASLLMTHFASKMH